MTTNFAARYTGVVDVTGGRNGQAVSDDDVLNVHLSLPKLNGKNTGTNPEQLFAAAWGGCFIGFLNAITRRTDIDVSTAQVHVEVDVGTDSDGNEALAGRIELAIPGLPLEQVQQLADEVHERCPYSRAVAGNVPSTVIAVEAIG